MQNRICSSFWWKSFEVVSVSVAITSPIDDASWPASICPFWTEPTTCPIAENASFMPPMVEDLNVLLT